MSGTEILAPAGSLESLKAAVNCGAFYCTGFWCGGNYQKYCA